MALYRINLSTHAFTVVEFETDLTDPQAIVDAFHEASAGMPTLCHQCTGAGGTAPTSNSATNGR